MFDTNIMQMYHIYLLNANLINNFGRIILINVKGYSDRIRHT